MFAVMPVLPTCMTNLATPFQQLQKKSGSSVGQSPGASVHSSDRQGDRHSFISVVAREVELNMITSAVKASQQVRRPDDCRWTHSSKADNITCIGDSHHTATSCLLRTGMAHSSRFRLELPIHCCGPTGSYHMLCARGRGWHGQVYPGTPPQVHDCASKRLAERMSSETCLLRELLDQI